MKDNARKALPGERTGLLPERASGRDVILQETRRQGTLTFPCTMYVADAARQELKRSFYTKPHWHDAFELLHFEEGIFRLTVNPVALHQFVTSFSGC